MRRWKCVLWLLAVLVLWVPLGVFAQRGAGDPAIVGEGDPHVLELMHQINEELAAMGLNIAVEEVEFFTIGVGRPPNRIHQEPFRWVAGDPRRLAQDDDITYLVDQSDGATASGLTNAQTEPAIDRGMTTWSEERCLAEVDLVKRGDLDLDPDIYDYFFGFGDYGFWFLADIVNAGWYPKAFFDEVEPPGGGDYILAMSVTFIFIDGGGLPTDINGDNYMDTALNEIYYNDNFAWGINIPSPGFDVETVALHENGHSLGVGHFGPPPVAVMNPVYAGIRQSPYPIDLAGMCTVWASWPK